MYDRIELYLNVHDERLKCVIVNLGNFTNLLTIRIVVSYSVIILTHDSDCKYWVLFFNIALDMFVWIFIN